jgi:hypothetical protein
MVRGGSRGKALFQHWTVETARGYEIYACATELLNLEPARVVWWKEKGTLN